MVKTNRRPTITDVANALGLSIATVSRALAKPDMVTDETRARVLEAVERLGYRPNLLARDLRRQVSKVVFVVAPRLSPFFLDVFQGVDQAARTMGYTVLLGFTDRNGEREEALYDQVLSNRADGLILVTSSRAPSPEPRKPSHRLPPIVVALEAVDWANLPTVRADHRAAAKDAVDYLYSLGHRAIAHIPGPVGTSPMARNRLEGYRAALAAHGLQSSERLGEGGQFTLETGYAAMQALLQEGPRPTAVFVANDEMAIGAIQAIKAAGLRVPHDISVMGVDDQRIGRSYDPALTTVRVPAADIGYRSMVILGKVLNGEPYEETVVVPTEIIVRQSTAPYPAP